MSTEDDPTLRGAIGGNRLRDELQRMSWPDRASFMAAFTEMLRRRFCQHCWYADPKCQCTNDE